MIESTFLPSKQTDIFKIYGNALRTSLKTNHNKLD